MLIRLHTSTPDTYRDHQSKIACIKMGVRIIRANEWVESKKLISIGILPKSFSLTRYAKANRLHVVKFESNDSYLVHPDKALSFMKKYTQKFLSQNIV